MKAYEFVKVAGGQGSPEWHAIRREGITATDAAVIAGLSPYKTPYQLWAQKKGLVQDQPAGAAAQRGIILEPAVAQWYEQETGWKVRASNGVVRSKRVPWMLASLDRTIVGQPGLLEIKTSASPRWSLYPVPPEVVAQTQWQMGTTGAPWVDVAVLLGGLVFKVERVVADPIYQADLFRRAAEFRNLLAGDTPPTLQGADSDALAQVQPQATEEVVTADKGTTRLAALYAEKQYESKMIDAELLELAIGLKAAIGSAAAIAGDGWAATWRQNKPTLKTDWEAVASLLQGLAPETFEEAVKRHTVAKPGARVFKFRQEGVGE